MQQNRISARHLTALLRLKTRAIDDNRSSQSREVQIFSLRPLTEPIRQSYCSADQSHYRHAGFEQVHSAAGLQNHADYLPSRLLSQCFRNL